jgi:sugar O-acyltransferase (sialic acid O-acetyltransferase NeuD family)
MNKVTDIVIVGAGGHARVVADVIRLVGATIHGFLDTTNASRQGTAFEGSTVLGGAELLPQLRKHVAHAVIAVGDNEARLRLADELARHGFKLATLAHPSAVVAASATLGPGSVVFAGAVINPAASIGANVIINTGATVDHDCVIADGAHIAPGAHLGGHVHVGRGALVGVGAAVKPGVTIGAAAVVGVGSAVVADVPAGRTVAGVPAQGLS